MAKRRKDNQKISPQFQVKKMKSGAKRVVPDRGSPTGKNAKPKQSTGFTALAPWKAFATKAKGGYKSTMAKGNKTSITIRKSKGK